MKTRSFTYVHGDSATSIVVSSKVATPTTTEMPSRIHPAIGMESSAMASAVAGTISSTSCLT